MKPWINLFVNPSKKSERVKKRIVAYFETHGYAISRIYRDDAKYNVVIGGDGTFLRAAHSSGFSSIPFVGINTGHLGFFQEIDLTSPEHYLDRLLAGDYHVDSLHLLQAIIETDAWCYELLAINEFVLTSTTTRIVHFSVRFDDVSLIDLACDGLLLSTPAGSTAYNLSAGGSILYQTLEGFQFTALNPVRSKRFPTLPASIVVPSHSVCEVCISADDADSLCVATDGMEQNFKGLQRISFCDPKRTIKRVVFNPDWYWYNLKDKFL